MTVEADRKRDDPENKPDRIRLMRTRLYTVGEVAGMLRVSERTVWRWLQNGSLKAVKLGDTGLVRIRGSALAEFLKPYRPKVPKVRRYPALSGPRRVIRRLPGQPRRAWAPR